MSLRRVATRAKSAKRGCAPSILFGNRESEGGMIQSASGYSPITVKRNVANRSRSLGLAEHASKLSIRSLEVPSVIKVDDDDEGFGSLESIRVSSGFAHRSGSSSDVSRGSSEAVNNALDVPDRRDVRSAPGATDRDSALAESAMHVSARTDKSADSFVNPIYRHEGAGSAASVSSVGMMEVFDLARPEFDGQSAVAMGLARSRRILDAAARGDPGTLRELIQQLKRVVHPNIYTALRLLTGSALFGEAPIFPSRCLPLTDAQCVAFVRLVATPKSGRTWKHLLEAGVVFEERLTQPAAMSAEEFGTLSSDEVLREWLVDGVVPNGPRASVVSLAEFSRSSELLERAVPGGMRERLALWVVDRRVAPKFRAQRLPLPRVPMSSSTKRSDDVDHDGGSRRIVSRMKQWFKRVWHAMARSFGWSWAGAANDDRCA
jgi:hypothetical protein